MGRTPWEVELPEAEVPGFLKEVPGLATWIGVNEYKIGTPYIRKEGFDFGSCGEICK